ncbi:LOB domain-containing protein 4 [Acorus calamus]|uniref:LOB domain-containing protein 4 n=1 Tax=Acorus calamus TaxID=4465 RepID=A0AAV9DLR8_ACOCL|nr:LOB domain-containing protein 4 [Acorus calamus]
MDKQLMGLRAKIDQPCAACRMLHRKCADDCLLAPYFPANEPEKFAGVHRVFGASNVIKMLQLVEASKREDAVKSMVYEAYARLRDPIYGCAGTISYLHKHVKDLEAQLEMVKARVVESQGQRDQLLRALMEVSINGYNLMHPMGYDNTFFAGQNSPLLDCNMLHGDHPLDFTMDYHHVV